MKKSRRQRRRVSEAQLKNYTILTRAARKLHPASFHYAVTSKWSVSETSSQATTGSDFTSKASFRHYKRRRSCRVSEAQNKNYTNHTPGGRKLHKWSISGTSSQAE